MSREIKFRAWNVNTQRMADWEEVRDEYGFKHLLGNDITVPLQFTGLKDKNGVEIYEGDIFGIDNIDGGIEATGKVVFDQDFAQFTIQYTNGGWAELWQHLQENKNQAREVIGNIYENPDLLEGEPNE